MESGHKKSVKQEIAELESWNDNFNFAYNESNDYEMAEAFADHAVSGKPLLFVKDEYGNREYVFSELDDRPRFIDI